MLLVAAAPVMAECNSGDLPSPNLLSSDKCRANANGTWSTAVGAGASATLFGSTSFGQMSAANGLWTTALGMQAYAKGQSATAVGFNAGPYDIAVVGATNVGTYSGRWGAGAGDYSTAIGAGIDGPTASRALGNWSIAIGAGDDPTRNGALADASAVFGIAIGTGAVAIGVRSTSIGAFAGNGTDPGSHRNQAFGEEAGQFVKGAGNTATGLASGYLVTGDVNTALGNSAGAAVTGSNNTAAGALAGNTVKGSSNAAYGESAGRDVTGNRNIAIGRFAGRRTTANDTIAIGTGARAMTTRSVAIGYGSIANVTNTVSVGRNGDERRIMNVAAGVKATDAVNVAQLKAAVAAVASGASPAAAAMPVAPEPPAISVVAIGQDNARHPNDDIRRELAELRALVKQQQQQIAQLESRVVAAAPAK
jgi:trimeric autotransporter adhesin